MNGQHPLLQERFWLDMGSAAAFVLALAVALWLLSLLRRDASIVDIAWGAGFVALAVLQTTRTGWDEVVSSPRGVLVLTAVVLWGGRLAFHILVRNWGHGEDRRYSAMRAHAGARFWWRSLFTVFLLQGALMLLLSVPHRMALVSRSTDLNGFDVLAILCFVVGFTIEVIADEQLRRFKASATQHGRVLDSGLWGWSRHPNYFGEALLWWGFWLFAVAAGASWTIFAPVLMTFLLLRVSGVTLLEKSLVETRPGYREYVRRTSAFWPRPPRANPSP